MNKEQAIAHLCETLELVAGFDGYHRSCDCICGSKVVDNPVIHDGYLNFVREAVVEKIQRDQEQENQI